MKKTLIALLGALGLALSQCPPALAQEGSAGVPAMQARQVAPNIYYVEGLSELGSSANQNFISNAGFVVTPAGVVVIDALGSPELARRLIAEIRKVTDNSRGIRLGNYVQIRTIEDEELEQVWSGKQTAKQALDNIVKRGDELLARFERTAGK